ncbi:Uncharacterized conserved protein, DUF305 family [Micromonospora coriariae]|uniref:Uncharacterized conserved protein, DUF305 family n=1 Tax=Micromonospora coriariae TaxID=285665 RepID=A0A1C4XGD5_9ACTN|nr:DUF305 domain-containing protein [Micromonospora coriariae]SCF07416.1 Uncharacterized conserved protein, DUF305 family [Micromonospora coriariae]
MRALVAAPPTLLIAVLLVAGCAAGSSDPAGTTAPTAVAPPSVAAPVSTAGPFSPTDTAWLQLTVAMAERVLPVLDLVPARTTDPAWRRLAAQVEATHRADLTVSRRLLGSSGAPATNPHEGHDMPGMISADELAALRSATGKAFQRLLAGHLRAHLTQAVRIAAAEQRGGVHPETIALAAAVVRAGTTDLARLDRLDPGVDEIRGSMPVICLTRPSTATGEHTAGDAQAA